MKRFFLIAALCVMAPAFPVYSQTAPQACACTGGNWGACNGFWGCGAGDGSTGRSWVTPGPESLLCPTNGGDWTKLKDLPAGTKVWAANGKAPGPTTRNDCASSVAAFDIAVWSGSPPPPSGNGSITVQWSVPPVDVQGRPSSITGYKIYYGIGALDYSVVVGNVSTHTLSGLAAGNYIFAIAALDATGESVRTGTVPATVNGSAPPPTDCMLSAWSSWTSSESWSACAAGSQSRNESRSRTIVTPAANGGAACGPLTETRVATQACTVTPTGPELCLVDGISGNTRPVYVESTSGTRGAQVGDLIVGPVSQPVGTPNPVSRAKCSCTDLKQWSGITYSKVQSGYVAGCSTHGSP